MRNGSAEARGLLVDPEKNHDGLWPRNSIEPNVTEKAFESGAARVGHRELLGALVLLIVLIACLRAQ